MINLDNVRNRIFQNDFRDHPAQKLVAAIGILGKTEYFGCNSKKTHPDMTKKFRNGYIGCCQHHAEVAVLSKVPRQSRHLIKLYVMRFLKDGTVSMARPCELCRKFLTSNGIDFRNVYYTTWSGDWKCLYGD